MRLGCGCGSSITPGWCQGGSGGGGHRDATTCGLGGGYMGGGNGGLPWLDTWGGTRAGRRRGCGGSLALRRRSNRSARKIRRWGCGCVHEREGGGRKKEEGRRKRGRRPHGATHDGSWHGPGYTWAAHAASACSGRRFSARFLFCGGFFDPASEEGGGAGARVGWTTTSRAKTHERTHADVIPRKAGHRGSSPPTHLRLRSSRAAACFACSASLRPM
jgi:hypothetical protein